MANDIESITVEAFSKIESEADKISRMMAESYKRAQDSIIKQMNVVYGKYLSTTDPQDYYNIMIQYDRLNNLLVEVQKEYNKYSKQIDGFIYQIPANGMTDMYYRQMYVLNWIAPEKMGLDFTYLDPRVVEWSVTGTTEAWQQYRAYLKEKFKNSIKMVQTGLSDTVYNPQYGTLAKLLKDKNMAAISKIQQEITQSFIQGLSMQEVSTNFKSFFDTETYKAERIARTELTRVANVAQEIAYNDAAEILDVPIQKMWVATLDLRTRSAHQRLDGQIADEDGYFHSGGSKAKRPGAWGSAAMNINCFTGDTIIYSDSKIKKVFKRDYTGLIYRIKTSGGLELSVTPNHKIFSPAGWVKAESFNKGDKIFKVAFRKPFGSAKNKIYNSPVMFNQMFDFFNVTFSAHRVGAMEKDFHGDGIVNGDIDIIFIKSFLLNRVKTFFYKKIKYFIFTFSNITFSPLFRDSTVKKRLRAFFLPFYGFMRSFNLIKSLIGGHFSPFKKFCFMLVAPLKTILSKPSIDGDASYAVGLGKFINRNSRFMELDEIVDIDVCNFSGHVFNLENKDNVYMASNIKKVNNFFAVVQNCRCSTVPIIDGEKPDMRTAVNPVTGEKEVIDYANYDTWMKDNGMKKDSAGLWTQKNKPDAQTKNETPETFSINLKKMSEIKMPASIKKKGIDSQAYKDWVYENWT